MLTENLLEDARSIAERITALRRAIHAEPELGLETPKTLAKVRAELADLPLEWREGPSCTGAVAVLNGGRAGRSALLRGDMDALPMPEETGLPFASTIPGRMHACGHDTHTAMLAGAARILAGRAETPRECGASRERGIGERRGGAGRRPAAARRDLVERVVERRLSGRAGEHERKPGEHEHDVRAEEVGVGLPAVGEEEQQVQRQPDAGGGTRREPADHEQSDHDLDERHRDAGELRLRNGERAEHETAGRPVREGAQLGADVGRGERVQETRVTQLLKAGVDERHAEEQRIDSLTLRTRSTVSNGSTQ